MCFKFSVSGNKMHNPIALKDMVMYFDQDP